MIAKSILVALVMPLSGGIRQQLRREREVAQAGGDNEEPAEPPKVKLKTHRAGGRNTENISIGGFLKSMYLIGRLSGPEFQEGSAATVKSQASDPLVKKVSKTGNSGAHRGNTHRDIMGHLDKLSDRPQVYGTDICFWDKRTESQVWQPCDFLLPHEVMHHEIGKGRLEDWAGIQNNPILQSLFEDWCGRVGLNSSDPDVLAFGIWGDSAVISRSESLFVLLFNCLSGICNRRFWVCAFGKKVVCQCGCFGRHTFDSIFRMLQWSFVALVAGLKPSIRDDGVPFSASKRVGDQARHKDFIKDKKLRARGGVIQKRGDWSWHKCALGMVGWGGEGPERRCCWKCRANYGSIPFRDFYETALWKATVLSHMLFMADVMRSGCYLSEIFNLPGFKHEYITGDLMHTGDLGVLQYLLGIVAWELLVEMGGSMSSCRQQLAYIISLIKTASRTLHQHKQPVNALTIGMIRSKGGSSPKLKVKASAARHLLVCFQYMLEHLVPMETPHAKMRFLVVKHFCSMYHHLQHSLGMTSLLEAASSCRRALILWGELQQADIDPANPDNWQRRGFFLWKLYPKHHLLQHVVEDQMLVSGNPVGHWCYCDESEIGAAVSLAETLQHHCLHVSVIRKHRLL